MDKPEYPMHLSPRCGARTRNGRPCQAPAMADNRRCRMHGGASPGAPTGQRNGNYRHGRYTAEALAERRRLAELLRLCRTGMAEMRRRLGG